MDNPSVRGIVHLIEPTKTYGKSGFRKRLVVLEQDNGRFTNYIPVEFIRDTCDSVDELNVGDEVEVTYHLSGRKWQRDANSEVKFFVSVEGTSFRVIQSTGSGGGPAEPPLATYDESEMPSDDQDDVPF